MPRVTEDHFENRKNIILDAALSVCMKKAVYEVSMSDVIKEADSSRGGVYKYFKNIDDVLIALINREGKKFDDNYEEKIEQIISEDLKPEQIIADFFKYSSERVLAAFNVYGKIFLDLDIPLANDQERNESFHSRIDENAKIKYLSKHLLDYISDKIYDGYFKPLLSADQINSFIIASFDGIVSDVLYSKYYQFKDSCLDYQFDGSELINSLCTSVILLLQGDIDLIEK